jgi:D-alanyl-D-alanine carboxypeptidase
VKRSALRTRTLRFLPVLLAVLSLAFAAVPATANERYAAIVYDANSGKTLFARNADARRYPASLTKIMTLYIVFEELDARRLSLGTSMRVSANAARQAPSKLGLKAGSTIKVEDAILALTTKSANDVAVAVAEHIGGSVPRFAERMTRTARALGMGGTTFRNPHGLPDSSQVTTARDMIVLARAVQDRFPEYYKYFSVRSFTYRGARYGNHNRLLGAVRGVDGIKTGYTRASGFNLVTNVERDGRHIIAVVMGGRTGASRNAHMRELIAEYLPKASRNDSLPPLVVATGVNAQVADARVPRARPGDAEEAAVLLGYAAAGPSHDVISAAMAEAGRSGELAQGDFNDASDEAMDPIGVRIRTASAVAELAPPTRYEESDPLARLTELARIRAGEQDLVAAGPSQGDAAPSASGSVWHVQIGAVPTEEAAQALIERARDSMGSALASRYPVTQEIEHRGETLYRARFAGFAGKEEARATCDQLKSKSFACLAMPN